jgi:hypothetical protein
MNRLSFQQLVAHPAVEGFDVAVLHRPTWRATTPPGVLLRPAQEVFEVNSGPLSETIMPGLPRASMSAVSSRATRLPEIEASGIAARHSRVTSSTMLRMRKRRPRGSQGLTRALLSIPSDIYVAHNIDTLLPAVHAAHGAAVVFDCM